MIGTDKWSYFKTQDWPLYKNPHMVRLERCPKLIHPLQGYKTHKQIFDMWKIIQSHYLYIFNTVS